MGRINIQALYTIMASLLFSVLNAALSIESNHRRYFDSRSVSTHTRIIAFMNLGIQFLFEDDGLFTENISPQKVERNVPRTSPFPGRETLR